MIVGIIRRKPVLTYASIIFGNMLASVNSVNSTIHSHVHKNNINKDVSFPGENPRVYDCGNFRTCQNCGGYCMLAFFVLYYIKFGLRVQSAVQY